MLLLLAKRDLVVRELKKDIAMYIIIGLASAFAIAWCAVVIQKVSLGSSAYPRIFKCIDWVLLILDTSITLIMILGQAALFIFYHIQLKKDIN